MEEELILGRNPVLEVLEHQPLHIEKVLLQKGVGGEAIGAIRSRAEDAEVRVQYVPEHQIEKYARGRNHQGVVALGSPVRYWAFHDLLAELGGTFEKVKTRKPVLLALDQITDPHNFGAILRTAVAVGVDGVVVPNRHMAPLNATVVKTSSGMAVHMPVARVSSLENAFVQCKEQGYWIVGLEGGHETTVWEMDWNRPLVLVLGSEGSGIRPHLREECDFLVSVPVSEVAESLNVSVAAGVTLYAIRQGREENGEKSEVVSGG